jgi:enamine deaminase RidA (YjgF/YER057c/UK114 family)
MTVKERLAQRNLVLPAPYKLPPGVVVPFAWVRRRGSVAYVSGHVPLAADGTLLQPLGKVGAEVTAEQGKLAARQVALSMLASLERELGDLEKIKAWGRVLGLVNVAPGFTQTPGVINGFSETIVELFGPERGAHARSAIGVTELPYGVPVEVEAEVEIA